MADRAGSSSGTPAATPPATPCPGRRGSCRARRAAARRRPSAAAPRARAASARRRTAWTAGARSASGWRTAIDRARCPRAPRRPSRRRRPSAPRVRGGARPSCGRPGRRRPARPRRGGRGARSSGEVEEHVADGASLLPPADELAHHAQPTVDVDVPAPAAGRRRSPGTAWSCPRRWRRRAPRARRRRRGTSRRRRAGGRRGSGTPPRSRRSRPRARERTTRGMLRPRGFSSSTPFSHASRSRIAGCVPPRSSRVLLVLVAFVAATTGSTIATASPAQATTTGGGRTSCSCSPTTSTVASSRVMPHAPAAAREQGVTFSTRLRQRLAVLPVAHDDPARPVLAQHRGRDQRRHERRLRDRARERARASTVATWLHDAGLPHRAVRQVPQRLPEHGRADTYVPPGWDEWYSPAMRQPVRRVRLHAERERQARVPRPRANATTAPTCTCDAPQDFVTSAGARRQAVLRVPRGVRAAPAGDAGPQDATLFPRRRVPRTPSYNEADVSDKPRGLRDLPRFRRRRAAQRSTTSTARASSRCRPSTAASASLIDTLQQQRAARQHLHRLHVRQRLPPRAAPPAGGEADRVRGRRPRAAHRPRSRRPAGTHVAQLTGNVDLAPTFAAMADVPAPTFVDGRSLLDLGRRYPSLPDVRGARAFLVEHRDELPPPRPSRTRTAVAPIRARGPGPGRTAPDATVAARDGRLNDHTTSACSHARPDPRLRPVRTLRFLYVAYANGGGARRHSTDPEIRDLAAPCPPSRRAGRHGHEPPRTARARGCRIAERHGSHQAPSEDAATMPCLRGTRAPIV